MITKAPVDLKIHVVVYCFNGRYGLVVYGKETMYIYNYLCADVILLNDIFLASFNLKTTHIMNTGYLYKNYSLYTCIDM